MYTIIEYRNADKRVVAVSQGPVDQQVPASIEAICKGATVYRSMVHVHDHRDATAVAQMWAGTLGGYKYRGMVTDKALADDGIIGVVVGK